MPRSSRKHCLAMADPWFNKLYGSRSVPPLEVLAVQGVPCICSLQLHWVILKGCQQMASLARLCRVPTTWIYAAAVHLVLLAAPALT